VLIARERLTAFAKLRAFIYWQLKRWAKYRHSNKNRWWIFRPYFTENHFTDTRTTSEGVVCYRLYRIAYVTPFLILPPFFVKPEECFLLEKYSDSYRDYMNRTTRWVGIPKSVEK